MMSGELTKLKIKAYRDERFTQEVANGEFNTLLNPEKYLVKYQIEQNQSQAQGTSSAAPRFNKALPEDLDLEFIFDRSGVIKGYEDESGDGIIDDVDNFRKVILDYNGDEHKPNYLVISWGALLFKGSLSQMEITFKLFKPDGTPIRASARARFKGFIEDDLRIARENNNSPDLTHVRIINEGDTLPLMTFRIYGDPKYYLEVAKANKLVNFRKLSPGQQIFFPPIEKVSKK
ncbi:MAG: LysM peptidoglycan-binding domain-containing protein [Bacteroidota bacterium]|nr:LysM peptidoglycan-binding domain-containing protein [Bacteroidota bacterium]